MLAALVVLIYSVTVAWLVPSVLTRLTSSGTGARLGVAVWLTALASVLVSAGISLFFLVRAAVNGWAQLAEVVCRSVSGGACTPVVYRSALFELGLGIAAALAAYTAATLAWRYGRRLQSAQQQTRSHAQAAYLTGRHLQPGTVVLDAPERAAYCVPPGIIVVTSAALGILAPAQLDAVLAHERAHLAGRHHLLLAVTRALAATFPGVPLFARGRMEIARLAEMAADDTAVKRAGRRSLIEALVAMGTGTAVPASPRPASAVPALALPASALGAASYAVAARVERLLEPANRRRLACCRASLVAALIVLPALTAVVYALAASA
jgi:beta-lactamase regulating signal transducer with metallopeptidase domain